MPNYRLNIEFSEKDLNTIYASEEQVIIVKHTDEASDKSVAWVSFKPFEKNTIDWSTNFAVYASNTEVQDGVTINKMSDKEAQTRIVYTLKDGHFADSKTNSNLGVNTYAIKNAMEGYDGLTCGLAQSVAVNGIAAENSPISARFVPYGQVITMTPIEKIDVYLRCDVTEGTVISHIASCAIPVTYGESEIEHTIAYDGQTGKFCIKK